MPTVDFGHRKNLTIFTTSVSVDFYDQKTMICTRSEWKSVELADFIFDVDYLLTISHDIVLKIRKSESIF